MHLGACLVRSHMKYGTYMCLVVLKPPAQETEALNCVLESLSWTKLPQFCRDPDDILQTHILGGPGVQCKIRAQLLKIS